MSRFSVLGSIFHRRLLRSRKDFKAYSIVSTLREEQMGPHSPNMLSEALGIAYMYFLEMVHLQL